MKNEVKYAVLVYLEYSGLNKRRYFNSKAATVRYIDAILGKCYKIKIETIKKSEIKGLKPEIR